MHGNHLKHMAVGGAVVLAALLLIGVSAGTALTYALILACPLMMAAMMFTMSGHGHGRSVRGDPSDPRDRNAPRPGPRA